ncbi:MAG: hypothetical protein NC833_02320 [Candidatus Omnitrophica bacterium]|nr:hypothetical protein [Candidatus Omnitrophota bacterium]
MGELKVGVAKYNITPPLDQARYLGPKGVAIDIIGEFCARATVFDDGKRKTAIVLLDISEFFPNITNGIRKLASKWTDIPGENILVCATHTHSGPRVIDYDDPEDYGGRISKHKSLTEKTQTYLNILYRCAASAVFLANSYRKPAKGKIGKISVPGIGRPRVRMKDGSIGHFTISHSIKDIDLNKIESESPYDDSLYILIFEDKDRKPICGLANFGCHNALTFIPKLHTDFFGWTMSKIENELGSKFVFSLMAGPEGNVHPAGLIEHGISLDIAESLVPVAGKILYNAIKKIWKKLTPLKEKTVFSVSKEVYFPWRKPLTARGKQYVHNRKVAGGKQDKKGCFSELQLIRIGELAILGLPGEVFHEIAMNLKNKSPFKYTWVISLCNDELSYIMPSYEHKRDIESGKMNVQRDFALTDENAENIIYQTYNQLFKIAKKQGERNEKFDL